MHSSIARTISRTIAAAALAVVPAKWPSESLDALKIKSRIRAATWIRQTQNEPLSQTIPSALLSYHNRPY